MTVKLPEMAHCGGKMNKGIADLMIGKSIVKLSGWEDWEVAGRYVDCVKMFGQEWITLELSTGDVYSYNLRHIMAIQVKG